MTDIKRTRRARAPRELLYEAASMVRRYANAFEATGDESYVAYDLRGIARRIERIRLTKDREQ
jgi:hypothetical protein